MANLTNLEAYNLKNEFLSDYFEPLTKEEATRQIFNLDKIQDSEDVACIRAKNKENNARAKSTQSVPFFVKDWEKSNKDIWKISGRFLADNSSLDLTRLNINNVRVYFAPGTSAKSKKLDYLHSIALDVDPTTVETIQNLEYYMEHFYNVLPFNMIVNSGNGLHIYFNFDKPVKLTQATKFHLKNIKEVISFIFSYMLGLTTHTLQNYQEYQEWLKNPNRKGKKPKIANTTQSILQKMSVPGCKTKFYNTQNQAIVTAYRAKKNKIAFQDFLISISNFVELFRGDLPVTIYNKIKLFIEDTSIIDELIHSQLDLSKTDLILEDLDKLYHLSLTPHKLLSSSKSAILKNISEVRRLLKQQDERRDEVVRGYRAKALKGRGKMLTILGFTRNLASNLKQFNKCLDEPLEDKEVNSIISEVRKLKGRVAYNHRTFKKDHGFYYIKRNKYINSAHKAAEEAYYVECGLNYGHGYETFVNPTNSVAAVYSENPNYYLMNHEALATQLRLRGIVGEKQYAEARKKVSKFFSLQAHNNYMENFKRLRSGKDLLPRPLNFVHLFTSEASPAEARTPYRKLIHTEKAIKQFQRLEEALAIISTLENTNHWNKDKERQIQKVSKYFQRFRALDKSIKTSFLSNELEVSLETLIQQSFNLYDKYNNVLIQRRALVKNGNYSGTEEFAKSILTNFNDYRKEKRNEQFIKTVSKLATNKVFTKNSLNNYSITSLLYRFKRNYRIFLSSEDVVNTYLAIHKLEDTNENRIVAKVNLAYELSSIIKSVRLNIRDGFYTTIQRLDKTTAQLTNETYSKTIVATAGEVESFIRTILNPVLEGLTDNLIFEMDYTDFNTTLPRNSVFVSEKLNKVIEINLDALTQSQSLLRLAS
jgi:hypothetical protein